MTGDLDYQTHTTLDTVWPGETSTHGVVPRGGGGGDQN